MTRAYYNENDPFAAEWLRQLMWADEIAPGDVDERSIEDVTADDLRGYDQHHFFAGIGVWSAALRLAGWPDDRPIWTGSCPCQPFSLAGARGGFADKRHLWPVWWRLAAQHRPVVIVGEQVASPDGLKWFDAVSADLESADYAVGAADLCAAGVGAPHIRQRLWWLGYASSSGSGGYSRAVSGAEGPGWPDGREPDQPIPSSSVGDASGQRQRADQSGRDSRDREFLAGAAPGGYGVNASQAGELADDAEQGREPRRRLSVPSYGGDPARKQSGRLRSPGWGEADWIACRDGKWRPVEPGTFPLAHGIAGRVGHLRGYGNALVLPLAATFIAAVMDVI